jgi:hypothetical protein
VYKSPYDTNLSFNDVDSMYVFTGVI